jgi:hypothetical protein
MEEIMEVLKICVALGVQACNMAVPILAENDFVDTARSNM